MAEIINIDAKCKLGTSSIQQFVEEQPDNTIVTMFIEESNAVFEKPLSEMRKFFEDESIEPMITTEDCVIYFMTETKILTILGTDFHWWIAPIRGKKYGRLKRLFNDEPIETEKKERKTKTVETHKCEIFKPAGENMGSIAVCEGKMKDLLLFVNRYRQIDLLKTFFNSDLQYSFDDGPLKTFEQLIEDGTFIVEEKETNS